MCKRFALLVLLCLLLTGCTVEADRIYVVCRVSNGDITCYKNDTEFYDISPDGALTPTIDPTLRAYPALDLYIHDGEYNLYPILPNLYKGTKTDVERYLFELSSREGLNNVRWVYSDYQRFEVLYTTTVTTYRILFNIYGEVRIYSENNLPPPYLNGE